MNTQTLLARSLALALTAGAALSVANAALADMVMYKSPYCGCCEEWGKALKASGIALTVENIEDMDALKSSHAVPSEAQSCHTAVADGYVFEGHVPLEAVNKVLSERPDIAGLAVPGMPTGALGMGEDADASYDVIALHRDGSQSVYMEIRP